MSDEKASPAFTAALANEQFILQSVSSTTVGEASSRAALYLSALSSGLVAVGFASASASVLPALVFTIFPTVFLLGCFTVVRLVDTSVENIVVLRRIEAIRTYWASLDADGSSFFRPETSDERRGVRYGNRAFLYTMASVIAIINSVLGGAALALVATIPLRLATPVGVVIGIVAGLIIAALSLAYERRRLTAALDG